MISDPNYNLPKDAFIRLFDNPIPAGDPARSEAPEWAQELDEVVVWAHMGENGEVTVKVNDEDIGGGGGDVSLATVTINQAPNAGGTVDMDLVTFYEGSLGITQIQIASRDVLTLVYQVPVPIANLYFDNSTYSLSASGAVSADEYGYITITGDCELTFSVRG